MAVIFLSDEDRAGRRSVKVFSTIQGARTGRWCQAEAGLYPDRCDCILEDLSNGVATHFSIQYGTVNGRRVEAQPVLVLAARNGTSGQGSAGLIIEHGDGRFAVIITGMGTRNAEGNSESELKPAAPGGSA